MDLDRQLQVLINEAPQYGISSEVMKRAVTPILKALAKPLQHQEYHILQTVDGGWVLTTLRNRSQPQLEKKVIYAFATVKDAANFQGTADPQVMAVPMGVTHILFQLFALKETDSVLFLEAGNLSSGTEIRREHLQTLLQMQLKELGKSSSSGSNLPPNLA